MIAGHAPQRLRIDTRVPIHLVQTAEPVIEPVKLTGRRYDFIAERPLEMGEVIRPGVINKQIVRHCLLTQQGQLIELFIELGPQAHAGKQPPGAHLVVGLELLSNRRNSMLQALFGFGAQRQLIETALLAKITDRFPQSQIDQGIETGLGVPVILGVAV